MQTGIVVLFEERYTYIFYLENSKQTFEYTATFGRSVCDEGFLHIELQNSGCI